MTKKVKIGTCVKVKAYAIVCRAVEEGINYGYNRAFKHTESPGEHEIKDHIEREVMNALCEYIDFGD